MTKNRISVRQLAVEAGVDLDECLIELWDSGFAYVNGPDDFLVSGDTNRARRALGVATRRELGNPSYWAAVLDLPTEGLVKLLAERGVPKPFQGPRLTKKAIGRLRAEVRARGLSAATPTTAPDDPEDLPTSIVEPLVWRQIGHPRDMSYLADYQIENIHEAVADDFAQDEDPIFPRGVKNRNLLASASHRPHTAIGDALKYPTIEMAAAALLHGLVHNHPFHNGNKRTALVAVLVFLDENCMAMTCDEDALFKMVLQLGQHTIAQGPHQELPDREVLAVADWLRTSSRWVEQGDRTIQWRRLERILRDYGCTFDFPGGTGGRVNMYREVAVPASWFRKATIKKLHVQTYYGGVGTECQPNMIKKIRKSLHLDDDHGVDSGAFYDRGPISPSDFIVKYRKTLKRLAKL